MGNMLPCLFQVTTLPSVSSKQSSHPSNLLAKTLHKINRSCNKAKATKKPPSSSSSEAAERKKVHGKKGQKKGVVRVKVVLTREEAAQLLSLTVHGEKTVAQIMSELKRMEAGRCANAACTAGAAPWRPALESIPEEW